MDIEIKKATGKYLDNLEILTSLISDNPNDTYKVMRSKLLYNIRAHEMLIERATSPERNELKTKLLKELEAGAKELIAEAKRRTGLKGVIDFINEYIEHKLI